MNNLKKQYLKEVKQLLPYDSAQKKHCLEELEYSIAPFIDNTPDVTMDTLYKKFGHPEEIAAAYLDRADPQKLSRSASIKHHIIITITIAMALLVILVCAFSFSISKDIEDYQNGYIVDRIQELPSEANPAPSPLTVN